MRLHPSKVVLSCLLSVVLCPQWSSAAAPSAEQALKLVPVQSGVDYDRPSPAEAAKCRIVAKKIDGHVGWVVESPSGVVLRVFVNTNDDNVVDQWSYYKDGLEVYRDIDANFNGKADQHRWFHTGGSRWGLDSGEDGVIDSWKSISAEEVTAEVVAAIATHDLQRFTCLLLTPAELRRSGWASRGPRPSPKKSARPPTASRRWPPGRRPSGRTPSGCSSAPIGRE